MKSTITYTKGCFIRTDLLEILSIHGFFGFKQFMKYAQGEEITQKRGRTVVKIHLDNHTFYLKRNKFEIHEFFKALQKFKINYSGARQEYDAIVTLNDLGIETVPFAAYGQRKFFGFEIESFLMTEELYGYKPFEKIAHQQWNPPLMKEKLSEKRSIITHAARLCRKLHTSGAYHQDFYLGHFFVHHEKPMALIDVQRLKKKNVIPKRYLIKDLAQLYFSAHITKNIHSSDCLRFFLIYRQKERLDSKDRQLIKKIAAKVQKIEKHTEKLLARRRKRGEIQ